MLDSPFYLASLPPNHQRVARLCHGGAWRLPFRSTTLREGVKDRLLKTVFAARYAGGSDHASIVQDQLARGFSRMRFEPALEFAYRDDQFNDSLKYLRINLAILIGLVFLVVQVDRIVLSNFNTAVPGLTRLGVMIPILILALA